MYTKEKLPLQLEPIIIYFLVFILSSKTARSRLFCLHHANKSEETLLKMLCITPNQDEKSKLELLRLNQQKAESEDKFSTWIWE